MNCLDRSSWKKGTRNPSNKQTEKRKNNSILNFHLKRGSEGKGKTVKSITNRWNFFCCPSVNSCFLNVIYFPFYDLLFKVHAINHSCFLLCVWNGNFFFSFLVSDKRCSVSQIENEDFFRSQQNEFVVYNGKWGKKRKKALFTIKWASFWY
jgi:hypothetical protein